MKQLLMEFKKIDENIVHIIKSGIKFTFGMNVIAAVILLIYESMFTLPILYYIGISLFKTSLFLMVGVVICGLAFHKIKLDLGI